MFEAETLARIVRLQQQSYRLLQWVGDGLRGGTLDFTTLHSAMGVAEAAKEWLGRNLASFPPDVRPERDDLDAFANLFASYLQTSFVLVEPAMQVKIAHKGCYCAFCTYLVAANVLRVRMPDKKAQQRARQMKELYLAALAAEVTGDSSYTKVEKLLSNSELAEDISFATYGNELLRRSQFASQGEGVLVLWREIAWDARGKVKKGFTLTAERILQAEKRLQEALTA
jgi:hypothetical protein